MSEQKEIVFLIKVMNGGGAERVISILANKMIEKGYNVNLILTHQKIEDSNIEELNDKITIMSIEDEIEGSVTSRVVPQTIMIGARILGKIEKLFVKKSKNIDAIYKYFSRNYAKIDYLRKWFNTHRNAIAIAFMYDSIFLTLLSAKKNRIIISERGDPSQYIKSRTVEAFINNKFRKADEIIYQSPGVKEWYEDNYGISGTVIYNSIKEDLPERFAQERNHKIVNFCRISPEKNLNLLIKSFEKFYREYPKYQLYIYGNSSDEISKKYEKEIRERIETSECSKSIHLCSARKDIHKIIVDYAMYISSSDHEGMSNSMLEAMAMGLPVICTDCPAGGARAIIKQNENGILVPVADCEEMYTAMKKIVDNKEFAERISKNAYLLRNTLSVEKISKKWEEIILG